MHGLPLHVRPAPVALCGRLAVGSRVGGVGDRRQLRTGLAWCLSTAIICRSSRSTRTAIAGGFLFVVRSHDLRGSLGTACASLGTRLQLVRARLGHPLLLAAQLGLEGPSLSVSAEALSGLVAVEQAALLLATGAVDAVLAGAVDLPGHSGLGKVSAATRGALAEGGAVFVLRRAEDVPEAERVATRTRELILQ